MPASFPEKSAKVRDKSMDESLRAQIETYLSHLDGLIRRGCQIRDTLAVDPSNTRQWRRLVPGRKIVG